MRRDRLQPVLERPRRGCLVRGASLRWKGRPLGALQHYVQERVTGDSVSCQLQAVGEEPRLQAI